VVPNGDGRPAADPAVYVDAIPGTVVANANSTALTDTNPVRIGASSSTGGYFAGQLDEVAV
jgi:hypothetical protein